jgi:succinylglutamate desuccinylase
MYGVKLGMNGDESLYALCDHESIVFPNPNVGLGRRAAVMVVEVPAHFENQQLVVIERERERIP